LICSTIPNAVVTTNAINLKSATDARDLINTGFLALDWPKMDHHFVLWFAEGEVPASFEQHGNAVCCSLKRGIQASWSHISTSTLTLFLFSNVSQCNWHC
jgi:hypothetical protein